MLTNFRSVDVASFNDVPWRPNVVIPGNDPVDRLPYHVDINRGPEAVGLLLDQS